MFALPLSSRKRPTAPPSSSSPSLLGTRPSSNIHSNANRRLFPHSVDLLCASQAAHIVLAILVSWRRVGDNEDGGDARGGRLAALSPTWLLGECVSWDDILETRRRVA